MSEFKHTPGPWTARESLVTVPGSTICRAHQHDGMRGIEETHANARVLAAGPEAVELLEPAIEAFEDLGLFHRADAVRALLSKIKGEAS